MNATKQLRALLKFQRASNPYLWAIAAGVGAPVWASMLRGPQEFSFLGIEVLDHGLFLAAILAAYLIAPERFFIAGHGASTSETEFLLTRAVDRSLVYRSKVVLLYFMVMIFPLASVLIAFNSPDLTIKLYSGKLQSECLDYLPGSTLKADPIFGFGGNPMRTIIGPTRIFIPLGEVLVAEWHVWSLLIAVTIVQALLLLLYPIRWKRVIYYTLIFGFDLGSFLSNFYSFDTWSLDEDLFFLYTAHQSLVWIGTLALITICHPWFERRFSQLEL
jgi:hypothetical protein